jgi:Mn-containing catalase
MFVHRKKTLFSVHASAPNPKFAQKLLEQVGGRSGECTAGFVPPDGFGMHLCG